MSGAVGYPTWCSAQLVPARSAGVWHGRAPSLPQEVRLPLRGLAATCPSRGNSFNPRTAGLQVREGSACEGSVRDSVAFFSHTERFLALLMAPV